MTDTKQYAYMDELTYAAAAVKQGFEGIESLVDAFEEYLSATQHGEKRLMPTVEKIWVKYFCDDEKLWRVPLTEHNKGLMEVQMEDMVTNGTLCGYVSGFLAEFVMVTQYQIEHGILKDRTSIISRNGHPFPQFTRIGG